MVFRLSEPPEQIEQAPADVRLWSRQELEERITAGTGGPFGVLWACDRYGDSYGSMRVPERLRRLLEDSPSSMLRTALLERLKKMEPDPSIATAVARGIDDRAALGSDVLYEALAVLAAHGAAEHFEVFRRYLVHPDDAVRSIAVEGVVESGRPDAPEAILGGFSQLNEPVAAFFLLQGLFALDDAGAAERAGRLVVEHLTEGLLESAYCLGVSLDPLRFGFYLHDRAMEALYPELVGRDERLDEGLADLLVVESDPAAKRRGETVAPAGVRRRLRGLARGGEHLRLVEALLDLLRRAVGLLEEESSAFAGRARVFLRFLATAVASPGFAGLGASAQQEFAIWAAGALAHVLRGRDPVREVEHARGDTLSALDLLATDVSLPPDVMVDILLGVPLEMTEELDEELEINPEGTTASRLMLLAARLPQKCLREAIELHSRNEDFRRDQAVLAARVAGDQVLPIYAGGLVEGDVEVEDFLRVLRSLGTLRSRDYLKWSFSAIEELGLDAASALDAVLACGDPELWRWALECFGRGRLHPGEELGRGDLVVRAAMLLELLGLEEDPGAVVDRALGAYGARYPGHSAAKRTSAVDEVTDQPARLEVVEQLDPWEVVADAARRRSESSLSKLRTSGGPPPVATARGEGRKVGRNDPCPCGSGKKYKKCCGARA